MTKFVLTLLFVQGRDFNEGRVRSNENKWDRRGEVIQQNQAPLGRELGQEMRREGRFVGANRR